jgi:hypothetical protein
MADASIRFAVVRWHAAERLVEWCLTQESQTRVGRNRARFRLASTQTSGAFIIKRTESNTIGSVRDRVSLLLKLHPLAVAVVEVAP